MKKIFLFSLFFVAVNIPPLFSMINNTTNKNEKRKSVDLKKHGFNIVKNLLNENKENNNNSSTTKVALISSLLLPKEFQNDFFKDIYVKENGILKNICIILHSCGIELHPITFPVDLCNFIDEKANEYIINENNNSYINEYSDLCRAEAKYFMETYDLYQKAKYCVIGVIIPDTTPCKICKKLRIKCSCKLDKIPFTPCYSYQLLKKLIHQAIYFKTKNVQKGTSQQLPIFIFSPGEIDFMLRCLPAIAAQASNIG